MTTPLKHLQAAELANLEREWLRALDLVCANTMALNLSRGKPAAEQLALSHGLEDTINGDYLSANGTDTRNYGELLGIAEARQLGAEILGAPENRVIAGGNSSLFLMHLCLTTALQQGLWGDQRRWSNDPSPKLIALVPGYDRHFSLTEKVGVEMVNVSMTPDGPDMPRIRELVAQDPSIKGIWCVPKYSNPTGHTFSDATVKAMAQLPATAAADDFVVLWDNAYAVHDLHDNAPSLTSIYHAAQESGTLEHVVQFASTSKVTFAGGGISFLSSGPVVLKTLERELSLMMLGPDKVNQLRHVRFLGGRIKQHMQAHAAILRPKFETVQSVLEAELAGLDIAHWTKPEGGYFVSLDLLPGLASVVVSMAQNAGLTLTPAGATFPYGKDPEDRNVRIAPSFATLEELNAAMQILTLCVKLASVRHLIQQDTNEK